jgi:hypothetical protein
VVDFAASHSLHEDPAQLEVVKSILAPHPYVVLVLLCRDPWEALRILNNRRGAPHLLYGFDLNERILLRKSNYALAKHAVYNQGKTVAKTSKELIEMLGLTKAQRRCGA